MKIILENKIFYSGKNNKTILSKLNEHEIFDYYKGQIIYFFYFHKTHGHCYEKPSIWSIPNLMLHRNQLNHYFSNLKLIYKPKDHDFLNYLHLHLINPPNNNQIQKINKI